MNFLCKLLIWSFLCCLLATRVQAQETERGNAERSTERAHAALPRLGQSASQPETRPPGRSVGMSGRDRRNAQTGGGANPRFLFRYLR
jgi:hypothetical protein